MAKIALVCKEIHPQILSLATQLTQHKNEVVLITSQIGDVPNHTGFEIIRPFKKWSAVEAVKLFTHLFGNMPDVFHFVFTNSQQAPTMAHFILSKLVQSIPHRVVASSFFHSPNELKLLRMKIFLRGQQIVTWGTSAHLISARRRLAISQNCLTEVIPPLSQYSATTSENHSSQIEQLLNAFGNYLLIPGNPEDFYKKANTGELAFEKNMKLVFLSERPQKRKHLLDVFYLGNPVGVDLLYAIQKSRGLLLAFSDLTLLELQQFYQWARLTGAPLLIRPRQTEMYPGIVLEGKTGWVLEKGEFSLRELLRTNPDLRIQRKQDQQPMLDLVDSTMNELNRLYHKAIALRH